MLRALKIVESLKLSSIVCLFDQAIYSKAIKIKSKEKEKFKNIVLMMGIFHKITMYIHILSKRFCDAGLRDVLIQSDTIAEGSIEKALSEKMYNRGIRAYKLMYEAIMRKVMLDYVETGKDIYHQVNWRGDLNFETFWQGICLQEKYNQFLDAREKLKNGEPLQKF